MKRLFSESCIVIASCLCAAATYVPACGAVFSRDWKTLGDGLLTYDDINRREWLDLSVTSLSQFPGVNGALRYEYAVGQLEPGGAFFGFIQAKTADVRQLALSAGVDVTVPYSAANEVAVGELIELIAPTTGTFSASSNGWLDETYFNGRVLASFHLQTQNPRTSMWAGLFFNNGFAFPAQSGPENGLFLYRAVVAEPDSWGLAWHGAMIAASMLNFRRARTSMNSLANCRRGGMRWKW